MSIYSLHSDVWEVILLYLDASDTIRLLLSGDMTLRSRFKPAFREFAACLSTCTFPSLYRLLKLCKDSCTNAHRFSISMGQHYYLLPFVKEAYTAEKWETVFPSNLETLELALPCHEPPFTSLLESLASLAPRLKKLCVHGFAKSFALPQTSLIWLELGLDAYAPPAMPFDALQFIYSLPTTLTHLKLFEPCYMGGEIDVAKIPFREMPLTVFHGNISFQSLSEEQACWSILPNTITELKAELFCTGGAQFPFPRSWKALFPSLTSLNVPQESLVDDYLIEDSEDPHTSPLSDDMIESIRASFPESLTTLGFASNRIIEDYFGLPLIVCALGDRLRTYESGAFATRSSVLKWLPKWENPRIVLLEKEIHPTSRLHTLAESENFEKFESDKNHPLSQLCRNMTSLWTEFLPASAISFLPKTITSLTFYVAEREPLSLETVSKLASKRSKMSSSCRYNDLQHHCNHLEPNNALPYTALAWPSRLTSLTLLIRCQQPLHLGCLPITLLECDLSISKTNKLSLEGDMTHLTKLSSLYLMSSSQMVIEASIGLPRSLRSLISHYWLLTNPILGNPEMKKNFSNLEFLDFGDGSYSADVLLYLPDMLKELYIRTNSDCLSEKHFESLSRTKLAFLNLKGSAKWPEELGFDVFSRFMPITLACLRLKLLSITNTGKSEKIAPYIPATLLSFSSSDLVLEALVRTRINEYRSACTALNRIMLK